MEALAIQAKQTTNPAFVPVSPNAVRRMSWLEFEKKYLQREDSFKYEWVNGTVIKTKRTMDFKQFFIIKNLFALFTRLQAAGRVSGLLITEGDTFFLENHRRPDLAWFSDEQISKGKQGISPVPRFVIEVISTKDQMNLVEEKMEDYNAAGVQVVWQIFPKFEKVHVYGGTHLNEMKVRRGDEICAAAPVLPDFELAVRDIFKD